jgi:hypothetical protein
MTRTECRDQHSASGKANDVNILPRCATLNYDMAKTAGRKTTRPVAAAELKKEAGRMH